MNEHLKLVRAFHEASLFPQAEERAHRPLSDMEVVKYQALLMEAGSEVLNAIKAGEMVEILLGFVDLAYAASAAVAAQGGDMMDKPVSWRHDGSVLSIMKTLSDTINRCTSGNGDDYSELYCLCNSLTKSFINADFDKAFRMVHNGHMDRLKEDGQSLYHVADNIRKAKLKRSPDLSNCLFE